MRRSRLDGITTLVVVAACGWIFSMPLRSHQMLLKFAQDDFYYYLKPAQNFAAGHGATFDGTTLTDGFHPLYFLLLAAASLVVHSLTGIFRLLWVLDVLSATAIFLLVRRVYARCTEDAVLRNALAIAVLLPCMRTIVMQMEVTLALPLGFAFLAAAFAPPERYNARRWGLLGILGALTMLARLDAGILVFCGVVGILILPEYRRTLRVKDAVAFLAAALPLPLAYFSVCFHYFHRLLPVSGLAKQMRRGWLPSYEVISSFHGTSLVLLVLMAATGVVGWKMRGRLRPEEKVYCIPAVCTPIIFFGLEMFLSDWKLWGWYLYVLRFSAAATFLLVAVILSRETTVLWRGRVYGAARPVWFAPALYAASVLALLSSYYKVDLFMVEIQHAALTLKDFAASHPGRYAMGDRAGMFGYMSASPVLQAEGLVMNPQYLAHIRREEDLRSVLRSYGVNYYIAFTETKKESGGLCFHATEPVIAGPHALRMHSDFCEAPLYRFPGFDGTYRVFRISTP